MRVQLPQVRQLAGGGGGALLSRCNHAQQASAQLGVARAALCSAQAQRRHTRGARAASRLGQDGAGGGQLDGIAQRRARAVHLQALHTLGGAGRHAERATEQRLLRGAVGRGEHAGAAVLVHRSRAHQSRGSQRHGAQQRQAGRDARLAARVAVRRRVQRLAATVGGEHAGSNKHASDAWCHHQIGAAGDAPAALAAAERHRGQVQSDERRRAGGVHAHAGALQAKHVGQPATEHAAGTAAGCMGRQAAQLLDGKVGVRRSS